jgi:hypothetical protein
MGDARRNETHRRTWQTYVSRLRTAGFVDEDGATMASTHDLLKIAR